MPYIRGLGYMKHNGRITRGTAVKHGPKRKLNGGFLLRGPGATVYLSPKRRQRFVPTRNLIRRFIRF